jgi:hypothetical protein
MAMMLCSGLAFAWSPPPLPDATNIHIADGNLKIRPTAGAFIGAMTIELEKTTLHGVREAAPRAELQHSGDAGDSMYWICFTVLGSKHYQHVWLISDSEMGGTDHLITGVVATEEAGPDGGTDACPDGPKAFRPIVVGAGVALGASRDKLRQIFGTMPSATEGWWSYRYQGKTSISRNGQSTIFDVTSSVNVRLHRGRVVAISTSQITSS